MNGGQPFILTIVFLVEIKHLKCLLHIFNQFVEERDIFMKLSMNTMTNEYNSMITIEAASFQVPETCLFMAAILTFATDRNV